MSPFDLAFLSACAAGERPDLLAPSVLATLERAGLLDAVGVVEIDPTLSDTAATQLAYGLQPQWLANCVVVAGRRQGVERVAACVVLASTRADVNGLARRFLDVRKASFVAQERAVELTGMEYGGITPLGLPAPWPVLIDQAVLEQRLVVIGSGVRRSKILAPGRLLATLPGASVLAGLGIPPSA